MQSRLLIAQLSDLHIGAEWEGVDPLARLQLVVDAVLSLPDQIDAVIVSGDLSDDWSEEALRAAAGVLSRFDVPVHAVPGNHDDRASLRRVFGLPGDGDAPVDYALGIGELRLVFLDSTVPGQDAGGFDAEQLRWLDEELDSHRGTPTMLVMHHPPLSTGIDEWDGINLAADERRALAQVVGRHPQLRVIVGGHLHRIAASALAGCLVVSVPSTCMQARPDFAAESVEVDVDVPGFALHAFCDGELSTQLEPVNAGR